MCEDGGRVAAPSPSETGGGPIDHGPCRRLPETHRDETPAQVLDREFVRRREDRPMKSAWLAFGAASAVALIALGAQQSGEPAPPDARTPARAGSGVARAELESVRRGQLAGDTPEATAIREVVGAFVTAYNARDAKAIASQFAE